MTMTKTIDAYASALKNGLRGLPDHERNDIIAEIKSHLEARAAEGRLVEGLAELGRPEDCARQFRDELAIQTAFDDGSPARTLGALLTMATRRLFAAFGLFFSGIFLIVSAAMGISAIAKFVMPDAVGLWVKEGGVSFAFGVVDNANQTGVREVLGYWYVPVAVGIAVIAFMISQWIGRACLKQMLGRNRPLPKA